MSPRARVTIAQFAATTLLCVTLAPAASAGRLGRTIVTGAAAARVATADQSDRSKSALDRTMSGAGRGALVGGIAGGIAGLFGYARKRASKEQEATTERDNAGRDGRPYF